jgi:ABC-type nitrate/sulfonate/bicarbonate transport system ATPase subunit
MIELRGVSKTVPSGTGSLTILHPLDLSIAAGRVVAITGPSGSGKSTLLGLLAVSTPPPRAPSPSTASRSRRSTRTPWRGCAARASGSSSSSFTCCRR